MNGKHPVAGTLPPPSGERAGVREESFGDVGSLRLFESANIWARASFPASPGPSPQPSSPLLIKDGGKGAVSGVRDMTVRINIETLHLHGYSDTQQQRFLRALETQLQQHASAQTHWAAITSNHIAQLTPLQLRAGTTPEQAAAMLAEQLFNHCTHHGTEHLDG